MDVLSLGMAWEAARPHVMVVACSDGRLQEATDAFLSRERSDFAGAARLSVYRFEVTARGGLSVATLHQDPAPPTDGASSAGAGAPGRRASITPRSAT